MGRKIEILAQTHTHTIFSGHAYSTVEEYVKRAEKLGLELVAITDHGPAIPDTAHVWHFANMYAIPHVADGIYVLRGAEANIIDYRGGLDLGEEYLKKLDLVIASAHPGRSITPSRNNEDHTNAYLGVIENPYVDIIGHCGWVEFAFDIDRVLKSAKENDKLIEINSHTAITRAKNIPICREIAKRCKELGVKIVVGADAHSSYELGAIDEALEILYDVDFPEELIMNTNAQKLISHLAKRRGKTVEEYMK